MIFGQFPFGPLYKTWSPGHCYINILNLYGIKIINDLTFQHIYWLRACQNKKQRQIIVQKVETEIGCKAKSSFG